MWIDEAQCAIDKLVALRDALASDDAVPTGELLDAAVDKLNTIIDIVERVQAAALPKVCPGEDQRDCGQGA